MSPRSRRRRSSLLTVRDEAAAAAGRCTIGRKPFGSGGSVGVGAATTLRTCPPPSITRTRWSAAAEAGSAAATSSALNIGFKSRWYGGPLMTRATFSLLLVMSALVLAACGGSGGGSDPQDLVKQTFGNSQKVKSGKVQVALSLNTQGI